MRHYGRSESSNKPQTQSHERIFEILFVWKKLNTKNTYHMTSLENIIGVSVQFFRSVVSDSLQPHGLQHASFPAHHQLSELTQTHVHWAGDAIHPTISSSVILFSSHPQSFPASGYFEMSCSHHMAKVLELQLQHQSFQWIFRTDFL